MTEERKHVRGLIEGDEAVEVQRLIATARVEKPAWADVVAGVKERKATIETPPAVEVQVPRKREMTAEEEREWNRKLIEAGICSRGRRRTWGIDRKISPLIRVAVDRRTDKQIDRSAGDKHVKHRIRRAKDRRVYRGAGKIKGVNPFKR